MDLTLLLLILMGILMLIFIILVLVWAFMAPTGPRVPPKLKRDVDSIKKQIEHEAEEESKEELAPFNKPPRLTRPSARKRI